MAWPTSSLSTPLIFTASLSSFVPCFSIHLLVLFCVQMVIFLMGLVSIILMRTLRKDYARYAKLAGGGEDLEALDLADESGWRAVSIVRNSHSFVSASSLFPLSLSPPGRLSLICSLCLSLWEEGCEQCAGEREGVLTLSHAICICHMQPVSPLSHLIHPGLCLCLCL